MFDESSENEGEPLIPEPEGEIAVSLLHNQIAQDMWNQYQELLTRKRMQWKTQTFPKRLKQTCILMNEKIQTYFTYNKQQP